MNPTQRIRGTKNPWIVAFRSIPRPRVRLFCFPYAGGGAGIYRSWSDALPLNVEVLAAQLPGRGPRAAEPSFTRMDLLIDALEPAIAPLLDRPFALFGHSMGGRIAFELARRARQKGGAMPLHLFISGCPAPGAPRRRPPLHPLPEGEFIEGIRRHGGTPEGILGNPELLSLLLPALRADFTLLETWQSTPEPPLSVPISVLGGEEDHEVPEADLTGWGAHTTSRFTLDMFPGGHFFLQSAERALMTLISAKLASAPSGP